MAAGAPGGNDNIALVLQSFSQNLRFLSNLQSLSPDNFNTSTGQVDDTLTIGIVVPSNTGRKVVGTPSSPLYISEVSASQTAIVPIGSAFNTTSSSGFVAQNSPLTIFNFFFANKSSTSTINFEVGAEVSNAFGAYTKVDIELFVNGVEMFSSRCYPGIDNRASTIFSFSVPSTSAMNNLIQVKAVLTPDSDPVKINVPYAYISVMES